MARTYWYAWWGILAAVLLLSQVLNVFSDEGFSWYRWLIALISGAIWTVVPLIIALQSPGSTRRFAFWWGTSVPVTIFLPVLFFTALGQTDVLLPRVVLYLWILLLVGVLFAGGAAVVVLWAKGRSLTRNSTTVVGQGGDPVQQVDVQAVTKVCPYCAEDGKVSAIKCKHCGSDLAPPSHQGGAI